MSIDRIEAALEKSRMEMLKDISVFDVMYQENLNCFHELELYIAAGKERIAEIQEDTLPKLRAEAAATGNPMDAQLVKNAELLKTNTIDTAKESNRGIVDIETLQKVNENLLATIDETIKIQKEGKEKRQAAEVELNRIENELKNKLIEVKG